MSFGIEKQYDELDIRRMLADKRVTDAQDAILLELARAETIYPLWPNDPIHMTAIMMEEAGEAVKEANDVVHKGCDASALRRELIQAGAMVMRCLINLEG